MSALPEPRRLDLRDAISQVIALGEKDPLTIARRLADLHGGDWIAEQLAGHWEEILAEIARQILGNERRAAVTSIGDLARERGKQPTKRDVVLVSLFVPSKGYITFGDATVEDLAETAAYRRRLAAGLIRWADWLDDVRARIESQGARRVRDFRGALPPLPMAELEGASDGCHR